MDINNIPIIIVITAVLMNIALGIRSGVAFSVLMIRSMLITIISCVLGYMLTETVKNAVDYSRLHREKAEIGTIDETGANTGNKTDNPVIDLKVPSLDSEELLNLENFSDDEFIEVNPVNMRKYDAGEQD